MKSKYLKYIHQSYQSLPKLSPEEILSFCDMYCKIEYNKAQDIKHEGSVISMFPYSSGNIHVGHLRNYIYADILYRYFTHIQGKKYIQCIGWDSFGSPAENAAINADMSPMDWTQNNIADMKSEITNYSLDYDWSKEIVTSDRSYYIHTQKLFEILYKNNYIYRSYGYVNYDPKEMTILSNEQVINGKGWRSGVEIEKRLEPSYFFDVSKIIDNLNKSIENNKCWPKHIIEIQKNWIGKIKMYIAKLKLKNIYQEIEYIECTMSNPKCFLNIEAVYISKDHELSIKYLILNPKYTVQDSILIDTKAVNPINGSDIKIIIDKNIQSIYTKALFISSCKHENNCKNNCSFDYTKYDFIYQKYCYKLHDWCLSRQRVWGCPINTYECSNCGHGFYFDETIDNLRIKFNNYDELVKSSLEICCTKCGSKCYICNETLDTFVDSSWYYMMYLYNGKEEFLFEKAIDNLPVTYYIGGSEHANLHLLYSQMITIALCQIYNKDIIVPFKNLITQGMILSNTYQNNNGCYISQEEYYEIKDKSCIKEFKSKMSKSKKNVVSVTNNVKLHKSDAHIRLALMSNYSIENDYVWDSHIVDVCYKFALKLIQTFSKLITKDNVDKRKVIIDEDLHILDKNILNIKKMYSIGKINKAIAYLHTIHNIISKYDFIHQDKICEILHVFFPIVPSLSKYYLGYIEYLKDN